MRRNGGGGVLVDRDDETNVVNSDINLFRFHLYYFFVSSYLYVYIIYPIPSTGPMVEGYLMGSVCSSHKLVPCCILPLLPLDLFLFNLTVFKSRQQHV
jgi:hypothetical protein